MKISKKWLEQYMDLSGMSMEEIAEAITRAGFEVEAIEPMSQGTNLYIGHVLECKDHPDSDHLHICQVDYGKGAVQIICGAPNVEKDKKVIVAAPGAKLPGGEIKAGKIRGEVSEGMLCSLAELGVEKHLLREDQIEGIELLDAQAPVGYDDPLEYLGLDDIVLDISLTPNRADCQAQFNMAKEIGAILNKDVVLPVLEDSFQVGNGNETGLKVTSETEKCPVFMAKSIGQITIKESPRWMKDLLQAAGIHSINNVVDISNLVMLETGQPMHFYDRRCLMDKDITIKTGFDQDYRALDGEVYRLQPEDIVITSQGQPIGIAGVMGGEDSKIQDDTTGIVIECALFDRVSIRNTARRLNLNTESSQRYQKGIEPLAAKKAMDRAVQLLQQYADAKDIEETIVFGQWDTKLKVIRFTLDQINRRLGTEFNQEEVMDVLTRLEFNPRKEQDCIVIEVPSSRQDVEGMADVSEEVIRMLGYDRLPSTLPLMEMTEGKLTKAQKTLRLIRNTLCTLGLQDCITYTLTSKEKEEDGVLRCGTPIELVIPLSKERAMTRTSILPSLLEAAAYNKARGIKDVQLFEISDVESHEKREDHLSIVMMGMLHETKWNKYSLPTDFYALKGIVEELLKKLGFSANRVFFDKNTHDTDHFHPGRSAAVYIGKDLVGIIGEIHPVYGKKVGTPRAVMAEMNLSKLMNLKVSKVKYQSISKYPSVSRDLAFVVDQAVPAKKIIDTVFKYGKWNKENIVIDAQVFDVYQGEHVEKGHKSIALNMTFQSNKQTLKEEEINQVFNGIIDGIEKDCQASLRR